MGKLKGRENQTMIKLRATVLTVRKYLYLYKMMVIILNVKCGKCEKLLINLLRRYFTLREIEGIRIQVYLPSIFSLPFWRNVQ